MAVKLARNGNGMIFAVLPKITSRFVTWIGGFFRRLPERQDVLVGVEALTVSAEFPSCRSPAVE